MANLIYLTLNGEKQGLISAGCSSMASIGNKAQIAHIDQIMVLALEHGVTRSQNVNHLALTIRKPVDKATPLLNRAITENEILTCDFEFYRTNRFGMNEMYYKIKLLKARVASIHLIVPHTITNSDGQPEESISFIYETFTHEHCIAGTSAFSIWDMRLF
ncbi:MAG: Hcp family type VI secretion system effector [Enterobacteriaceae bacterium]|nr:Hcp family type VI secretion system effector [Enterobacteriaceae bacterium]